MTQDILDRIEKRMQEKIIEKNSKHNIGSREKKCDEAKEIWLNHRCSNNDLYHRSTEPAMYKKTLKKSFKWKKN